jgi:hypothetical protein
MAAYRVSETIGITREDLTRDRLKELPLWPGCETVESVAVFMTDFGKFTVHVVEYGLAIKRNADRALKCIRRRQATVRSASANVRI